MSNDESSPVLDPGTMDWRPGSSYPNPFDGPTYKSGARYS